MAGSGSYARGDQPRTVADPDAALYEATARRQREYNARQETEMERRRATANKRDETRRNRLFAEAETGEFPDAGHPGALESLIPIWGSGREALADFHDGNYIGAAVNGALAVSDAIPAKAIVGTLAKGGIKVGKTAWRAKPWEAKRGVEGVRDWMTRKGFARPGQPVHHWAIPQGGWGRRVPDWFKNQLWNLKPLEGAVEHGRIHGPYTVDGVRLPQFGPVERFVRGTPDWAKAGQVSAAGHGGTMAGRRTDDGHW